jgi:hypothetical protein
VRGNRPIAEVESPWLAAAEQLFQTRSEIRPRELAPIGLAAVGLDWGQDVHITGIAIELRTGAVGDGPAVERMGIDHPPAVELLHDFMERHSGAKSAGLALHGPGLQGSNGDESDGRDPDRAEYQPLPVAHGQEISAEWIRSSSQGGISPSGERRCCGGEDRNEDLQAPRSDGLLASASALGCASQKGESRQGRLRSTIASGP